MLYLAFLALGIIILLNYIKVLLKSEKPVKVAAVSMLTGVFALGAASLITGLGLLGAQVAVNLYTVFISLTLGIPGVVFIIVKMFFM